jgi:hypothetical protein
MMTDNELRAELAMCEAATRGPWEALDGASEGFDDCWDVIADDGCGIASMSTTAIAAKYPRDIEANAKFMAKSRTGYPAVLREMLELKAMVREQRSIPRDQASCPLDEFADRWWELDGLIKRAVE